MSNLDVTALNIVSSSNKKIWDAYGRTCFMSWLENIKTRTSDDVVFWLTFDGPVPDDVPKQKNINVISLDNIKEFSDFLEETKHIGPPEGVDQNNYWRYDFRRFWPKVFTNCWISTNLSLESRQLVFWWDIDLKLEKPIELERLVNLFYLDTDYPHDLITLERGEPWGYMDSGFMGYTNECFTLEQVLGCFVSKVVFEFKEWHDAYITTQISKLFKPINPYYLTDKTCDALNPIERTWLGEYFTHYKGNRKTEISST